MVVACIQARMGSTRLPKKVLMDLNGAPTIVQIARRLSACTRVDRVVVATSSRTENQVIVDCANANGLAVYAGSEEDIVDRMYQTAKMFGAAALVRITADCPFVDPQIVDAIVDEYLKDPSLDFVSNIVPPTYPDGLDVELMSMEGLTRLWERTRNDAFISEWYSHDVRNHPELYRTKNLSLPKDLSQMRWTVDYPEDMAFAREVFKRLSPHGEIFHMDEMMRLLKADPRLEAVNAGYVRDEGYHKALAQRLEEHT